MCEVVKKGVLLLLLLVEQGSSGPLYTHSILLHSFINLQFNFNLFKDFIKTYQTEQSQMSIITLIPPLPTYLINHMAHTNFKMIQLVERQSVSSIKWRRLSSTLLFSKVKSD